MQSDNESVAGSLSSSDRVKVKQRDDDPSENMWSVYMDQVEKRNRILADSWKADMNSILIFAGLFSSSLTAFVIESYRTLTPPDPDPIQATLNTMLHLIISQSNITNSSISYPLLSPVSPPTFVPPTSALICNTLWFSSLAFSLICALSATMVDQWARNYILATESRPSLHKRARISAYLHRGIRVFQMNTVVELIPTLLHISLLLFFAGLVEFLRPINAALSNLVLGMLLLCGSLYLLVTFLPIFHSNCPYYTPLSSPWWHILRTLGLGKRRTYGGATRRTPAFESIAEAREADAIEISQGRDDRDFEAMRWTLSTLREDSELEPLIGFIPQLVSGFDYSAKLLLHKLLREGDPAISLRYRTPRLLGSCAQSHLSAAFAHNRATTCLQAIWSLTMMAVPLSVPFTISSRETLAFDEETLNSIHAAKKQVPSVSDCADSTASVVARSLLDMFVDTAAAMEEELATFLRSGHMPNQRTALRSRRDPEWATRRAPLLVKRIQQEVHVLEQLLSSSAGSPMMSSIHTVMETLRRYLDDLICVVASSNPEDERPLAEEALEQIRTFQQLLNDAGFSLTLEYISTLIRSPASALPYEAFNTLRRLFLKINFDLRRCGSSGSGFSARAQSKLVHHLDAALEQNPSRGAWLPPSIINILLELSGSALSDPGCAMKARGVINHYLNVLTAPVLVTRDTALKAISQLDSILPADSRPHPVSHLLSSHMYANTKLDRKATSDSFFSAPAPILEAAAFLKAKADEF